MECVCVYACECECMCGSVSDRGCMGLSLEVKVGASDNGVWKDLLQDSYIDIAIQSGHRKWREPRKHGYHVNTSWLQRC